MDKNKVFSRLILFFLVAIPYFPLFGEIDRIASQWAILSLFNFLGLVFIFINYKESLFKEMIETKPIIFFGLFLLSALLSFVKSVNITESLVEFFRYSSVFILLIILPILIKNNRNNIFLIGLLIGFSIIDIIGLYVQNIQGLPPIGFTGNKNIASASLLLKSSSILFLLNRYKNIFVMIFCILFSISSYLTVFTIGSKAGFLTSCIIISILIITLFLRDYKFKMNLILIFSILTSSLISLNLNNNLEKNAVDTFNYLNDQGSVDRLRYYSQAIESFIENPFLGIGLGNWKIYSIKYDSPNMINYIVPYHSHNDYLQLLAEIGIGSIFYLLFIISIFILIYKTFKNFNDLKEIEKIILLIAFLSMTVYLVDSSLNFPAARVVMQLNLASILALIISVKKDLK